MVVRAHFDWETSMDWKTHKAVAFVSDDWGMYAWTPDMEAYKALEGCGFFTPVWSFGTLETPRDMGRLFDVLLAHKGGDGRPVVFQPYYIGANPDYDAIEANGFTAYVDCALGFDIPPRWQRGDFIGKALEGWNQGIWQPEYHCRCHHFSGIRWVQKLKAGEKRARAAWEQVVYVCETVSERLGEYEGMEPARLREFIEGGFEMFQRTFGYRPNVALTSDWVEGSVKAMAGSGIKAVELVGGGEKEGVAGTGALSVPTRNAQFEPLGNADSEVVGCLDDTLAAIEALWADNQPAMVSSHRTNYVSLDSNTIDRNFALFEELLGRLLDAHPETVFLTGWEAAQLNARGVSVNRFGDGMVVRNYTSGPAQIEIDLPEDKEIQSLTHLPSGISTPCQTRPEKLNISPGEFLLELS